MCQRTFFSRSCRRMAEEVQLRAEEEFMVEALKMIKQQRNCLQIERLHLESLKQQLMDPKKGSKKGKKKASEAGPSQEPAKTAQSKPTELMSAVDMMNLGSKQYNDDFTKMNDDMQCNNQELDLNLNLDFIASAAGTSKAAYPSEYDYNSDDASSSDASDGDDVMIDMNMLMHGSDNTK